jgi:HAD superfamily hydrolase (TIGR01549 family)
MKKAILYDMGDIFFESHLWRKWMWQRLCEESVFEGSFKDFYETYEKVLEPVYDGRVPYADAYSAFITSLNINNPKQFIADSFEKKEYYETYRDLYDGVKETLKSIQEKGIENIIISDNESGEKKIRENILKRFEINEHIDHVYSSLELQNRKPHPDVFKYILNAHGLKPDEVYFVAHDQDEIDGAVDFGLDVIEYNNYLNWVTKAQIKVSHFSEIGLLVKER